LRKQDGEAGLEIDIDDPRHEPHFRRAERALPAQRRLRELILDEFDDHLALGEVEAEPGLQARDAAGEDDVLVALALGARGDDHLVLQALAPDLHAHAGGER
jgi:hypothetical protein